MSQISRKQVKTRSSHQCWGCGKDFPIGSSMERQTEADGGQIWSVYWCDVCMDYLSSMPDRMEDDQYNFGELVQDEEYLKFKKHRESGWLLSDGHMAGHA